MKQDKKHINEVLDDDGNLMTRTSMGPENNRNNITKSTKTTDYNIMVGRQVFDDDFLGRFGFHFYESKDSDDKKLIDILAELEFEQYKRFLDFFIKNFSKENLKIWKSVADKKFEELTKEESKSDYYNAAKVVSALKEYVKSKEETTLEEEILAKKTNNDVVNKSSNSIEKKDDKELASKKVKDKTDKILKDNKI
jgi:hypothetical protein